jgi:3-phenylpropionate/cinnamic acid dioxygenase small subunit
VPGTPAVEIEQAEVEEEPLSKLPGEKGREKVEAENKSGKPDTIVQRVTLKRDTSPKRVFSILDRITGAQKMIIQPEPPARHQLSDRNLMPRKHHVTNACSAFHLLKTKVEEVCEGLVSFK